jgi:urease accessory protein
LDLRHDNVTRIDTIADPHVGVLEVTLVNGQSAVTRSLSHSPLKLVVPQSRGASVWAFTSTFGGGLVSGDAIDLEIRAGHGTTTLLSTQASTKVFRSIGGLSTRQTLHATVESNAVLIVAPDALTCFAGAIHEQGQRFDLAGDGGLVLIDWLTSGRSARGERWAFDRYQSRNDVFIDGQQVYRDSLLLDPADGPLAHAQRLGRFDCLATVVILGQRVMEQAQTVLRYVAAQPIGGPVAFAASPLKDGAVLRIAGAGTQAVGRWIRERLSFITNLLGNDPWARKI